MNRRGQPRSRGDCHRRYPSAVERRLYISGDFPVGLGDTAEVLGPHRQSSSFDEIDQARLVRPPEALGASGVVGAVLLIISAIGTPSPGRNCEQRRSPSLAAYAGQAATTTPHVAVASLAWRPWETRRGSRVPLPRLPAADGNAFGVQARFLRDRVRTEGDSTRTRGLDKGDVRTFYFCAHCGATGSYDPPGEGDWSPYPWAPSPSRVPCADALGVRVRRHEWAAVPAAIEHDD